MLCRILGEAFILRLQDNNSAIIAFIKTIFTKRSSLYEEESITVRFALDFNGPINVFETLNRFFNRHLQCNHYLL